MMLELKEDQRLHVPELSPLELEGLQVLVDGEAPNWLATGRRGARLLEWLREPLTVGALSRRYAEWLQMDAAQSWLHVHSFVRDCLRRGMVSFTPFERAPYAGRSAHLSADKLSEVWDPHQQLLQSLLHPLPGQLLSGGPIRGSPPTQLLHIIDQACECGVERFYFTGGEPFARPDIFELIEAVTEKKHAELIILTNGLLFQGKRLDRLAQLGRDRLRLQISLDGAVAETNDRYRGRGTFDRIAEGTRAAAGLGFPVLPDHRGQPREPGGTAPDHPPRQGLGSPVAAPDVDAPAGTGPGDRARSVSLLRGSDRSSPGPPLEKRQGWASPSTTWNR